MSLVIAYITLTILILLVWRQIKVWRTRVLLSPGFYFGVLWILGVFGSTMFFGLELLPVTFPKYIDELNVFVGFTGLSFLIITPVGRSKINNDSISLDFTSEKVFRILSLLMFFAAVFEFSRTGFNLNMGDARMHAHDNIAGRPAWVNYLSTAATPLSIWAGAQIMSKILSKATSPIIDWIFLAIPLIANLIFSITVGGRVDFVYGFVNYFIGMAFIIPINKSIKEIKKPLIIMSLALVCVMMFITGVAKQRSENSMGEMSETQAMFEDMYPRAKFLYGPIVYMTESYVGYQYRRDDAVNLNELGLGQYTFNGFINWTLPFASAFGVGNTSIAHALNIHYDNKETYDFERDYYDVVHSGYIPIVKDFGVKGAFVCIIVLAFLSHMLFVRIQKRSTIKHSMSLFMFMLFLIYWLKMNYLGTLSQPITSFLYGYLIVELFNIFIEPLSIKRNR